MLWWGVHSIGVGLRGLGAQIGPSTFYEHVDRLPARTGAPIAVPNATSNAFTPPAAGSVGSATVGCRST